MRACYLPLFLAPLVCASSALAQSSPPDFDPNQFPIAPVAASTQTEVVYKLKGDAILFPSVITDDAMRTYMEWEPEREMPAVFAINEQGQEILVDGYMRNGRYTIDRVYPQILFRLDKAMARAIRTKTLKQ